MCKSFPIDVGVRASLNGEILAEGLYVGVTEHGHLLRKFDERGQWIKVEVPATCLLTQEATISGERKYVIGYFCTVLTRHYHETFRDQPRSYWPDMQALSRILKTVSGTLLEELVRRFARLDEALYWGLFNSPMKRIRDQSLLLSIALSCKNGQSVSLGRSAVKALARDGTLYAVIHDSEVQERVRCEAVASLSSQKLLHEISRAKRVSSGIREAAALRLTHIGQLNEIVRTEESGRVRVAAHRRILELRKERGGRAKRS